jgi:cytochrome c-type biogenesis protein CcmH/NrfF
VRACARPARDSLMQASSVRVAMAAILLATVTALFLVGTASADPGDDLINELMCPSSGAPQPLATSNTSDALWMRSFIKAKVAEGWSRQRIVDTLVRQYGEQILPAPPKEGFGLAAWTVPFVSIVGGVAVLSFLLGGWLRGRKLNDAALTAEMASTIDEDDLRRYEDQLRRELEQFE